MAKHETNGFSALLQYRGLLDGELAVLAADADPEVRAIAGEVIAHLESAASSSAESQRLEETRARIRAAALQALSERPGRLPLAEAQRFLTDPQRSVRQAAVRAFLSDGREGVAAVYEEFLKTNDKSLRDLIIEELDHSGVMLSLLQNLGDSPGNLESRVVQRLVTMGATHHLKAALFSHPGRSLVEGLLENLEDHSPPKIDAWLGLCAALKPIPRRVSAGPGPAKLAA